MTRDTDRLVDTHIRTTTRRHGIDNHDGLDNVIFVHFGFRRFTVNIRHGSRVDGIECGETGRSLLRVDGEAVGSPVLWSGPDKLLLRTKGPPPKQRARRVSVNPSVNRLQAVADLRVATQRPASTSAILAKLFRSVVLANCGTNRPLM
jgi:hypothetical protein